MLILSRFESEKIIITAPNGDRITLMLVEVRGQQERRKARIGIDAPRAYAVHREEVQVQIDTKAESEPQQDPKATEQSYSTSDTT